MSRNNWIKYGYHQINTNPGFRRNNTRPIYFALFVDDFGVKYVGKENTDHLIKALKKRYIVEDDWEGKKYCSINLYWDYIR